jgi:hypothetical protein
LGAKIVLIEQKNKLMGEFYKYSAKSGDFLRFFAYLCHVIEEFACFDLQH